MGARNTLPWIRCSLCGRRMRTRACRVDGDVLTLCRYCMIALSGLGRCGGGQRRTRRMARTGSRGPSSSLLKRLGADNQ